jgi:rubrerythrin
MLSTALEMEKKGREYYDKAVSTCHDETGREIFRMLMNDEVIHVDRILKIYESLKAGKTWSDDWKSVEPDHKDLGVLFREMASAHGKDITAKTGDLEAIDVGIDLELRAIAFYEGHLSETTDALEREFLEHIIMEEKSHHAALSDLKLYLSDPSAWFIEQEHTGLDGA